MPSSPRVERLLAAMTLAEKIGQLTMSSPAGEATGPGGVMNLAERIASGALGNILNVSDRAELARLQEAATTGSRLGIPVLFTLDVVHGWRTIMPIPLGETAAFDPDLWRETAALAAREAAAHGVALTFAPMLDVCRDPRWGRIAEGPGEDPWVAGLLARAKVAGFQGDGAGPFGLHSIAATAKHFGAYGAVTAGRDYGSVDVSERQLEEVYFPPFRAAVEAGVAAIMPAFVDIAGVPATAHRGLLRKVLRDRWGFDGVLISDYGAIGELIAHGVAADLAEAAALALRAGVDIDMMSAAYERGLPEALDRALVTLAEVDEAVRRVLALKERLGLFEAPMRGAPAAAEPQEPSPEARALARRAAARSLVLLRNDRDVLPLAPTGGAIALIGPRGDEGRDLLGPWSALGLPEETAGLAPALQRALPDRRVVRVPPSAPLDEALRAAAEAECILLCLGEEEWMSGEAASRTEPVLPEGQADLARAVLALGKPTVMLLWSGRPLIEPDLLTTLPAALAVWFPGSEAGPAIADVLTGACDAVGRLPVSWPARIGQIPIFYAQRPTGRPHVPGQRYATRYLDAPVEPLFPFGHGLSYARFEISDFTVDPPESGSRASATVVAKVRNVDVRSGEQTLFLFVRDVVASVARPLLELRGVAKIVLAPGEAGEVRFTLSPADLAVLGEDMVSRVEPGLFEICVGTSADPRSLLRARLVVGTGS